MSRLVFVQSDRWQKRIDGGSGVYDETLCCYCARPVGADPTLLRTARTNDGEWWLVSEDEDLSGPEWKDFQAQLDGSRAPTLLPIGPDCLRGHVEFHFAVVDKGLSLDDLPFMGSPTPKKWHSDPEALKRRQGKKQDL